MEDDFLSWKSKILPQLASYFGITADMAKAIRARPHLPVFDYTAIQNPDSESLFHGEYSTGKPRRWQLKKSDKKGDLDGFEVITKGSNYNEIT